MSKENKKNEKYGKQYRKNIFKEYMKEYLKEYRKKQSKNVLKNYQKTHYQYLMYFRDTTTMPFLTKDEEVLLKYNKIWSKIKSVKKINLLVTQCLVTNICRLERNDTIAESPQIVMVK